jgi:D-alanyl-D-alanine carboxypeptidase/D-alanyl-D-alanine-endopeptidase (penicillin-binding protein 4)
MKVSQNLYAETLLRTLGAQREDPTAEGGRKVVQQVLESWGIPPDGLVQRNGSGLSRYDYVTAETLVRILTRMHRDPRHADRFADTLPLAGRDGTLARRMKETRAEGNARAKTGSIANVRALSGYVRTLDDEMLAFSIIVNTFSAPQETVDAVADRIVERLANFTRKQ